MRKARNLISIFSAIAMIAGIFVGCKNDSDSGPSTVALKGISLSSLQSQILHGDEKYLSLNYSYEVVPIFTPANATNKNFTIEIKGSDNAKNCIVVDDSEKTITATSELPEGETISIAITSESVDEKTKTPFTDEISGVTVKAIKLQGISFEPDMQTVYVGRKYPAFAVKYNPEDASYKNVTWALKSGEPTGYIEVSEIGEITVKKPTGDITGKDYVVVTATSDQKDSNEQFFTADLKIKVEAVLPTKMTLKKTTFKIAKDGGTLIVPVFEPADTTDQTAKFEVTSGDSVTVDANTGVVTAVSGASGTTTIKVTSNAKPSLTATATISILSGTDYVIEENDTALGFVSSDVVPRDAFTDYRASNNGKIIDNPKVVIYSIYSATEQDVDASILYAYVGNTFDLRAMNVIVNGGLQGVFYCNFTNNKGKYTGEYDVSPVWQDSNVVKMHLDRGENQIRLEVVPKGTELQKASENDGVGAKYPKDSDLEKATNDGTAWKCEGSGPLIDNFKLVGIGLGGGGNSLMFYSVATSVDEKYGTITVSPNQASFKEGTSVTVTCTPKSGYKFDAWYQPHATVNPKGSNSVSYTFTVDKDYNLKAHVIPDSYNAATENAGIDGYATVCDDNGTKYTITGGAGGETITIGSYEDLMANKSKLSSHDPYIVKITARIESPNTPTSSATVEKFDVGSNKTIFGEGGSGTDKTKWPGLKGIYFNVYNCENVIVKNLVFGEVLFKDAFAVHTAQFIWIDHCLFYSPIQPDKDKYDGLLDIKNGTRFMTISNCEFKDHWKAILCGSSDVTENGDTKMRLTFFGNNFYNVGSRLPLFRYGKLHMYNNNFDGAGRSDVSCVNMRKGSEGLIEYNYFANAKMAIGYYYDETGGSTGYWNVRGNVYDSVTRDAPTSSTTSWTPCYTPSNLVTNANTAKTNAIANAGPKYD